MSARAASASASASANTRSDVCIEKTEITGRRGLAGLAWSPNICRLFRGPDGCTDTFGVRLGNFTCTWFRVNTSETRREVHERILITRRSGAERNARNPTARFNNFHWTPGRPIPRIKYRATRYNAVPRDYLREAASRCSKFEAEAFQSADLALVTFNLFQSRPLF